MGSRVGGWRRRREEEEEEGGFWGWGKVVVDEGVCDLVEGEEGWGGVEGDEDALEGFIVGGSGAEGCG